MSRKNVLTPYHWLVDGDMSSATLTSEETEVTYTDNVGISVSWTGNAEGVFAVEATIDGVNWSELNFGIAPQATGSADTHLLNLNQIPYKAIRLTYIKTTGTGTLNSYIMYKQTGG